MPTDILSLESVARVSMNLTKSAIRPIEINEGYSQPRIGDVSLISLLIYSHKLLQFLKSMESSSCVYALIRLLAQGDNVYID